MAMNEHTILYRIRPAQPAAHVFTVTCTVAHPDPNGQQFFMPAWIPGSYTIRDFARNVVRISAECAEGPIPIERLDKNSWQCPPRDGPITVDYDVYAWDLSVRGAHLDTTHGYFNGTCVFLLPIGHEGADCHVLIEPPPGAAYSDWRVATTLDAGGAQPFEFGTYQAENYDDLIDHPVEMGRFAQARFEACGVPHDIVITGRHHCDVDRLCEDLTRICEHHIRFFDAPPPMSQYLFLVMAVGEGYGGLEHRRSTSLLCSREDLPSLGEVEVSERYRTFLGLCSHEYFHTWNVKRIKPRVFVPYRLDREVHTRLLWVFEGITSYYDDLGLRRAGLISRESYLQLLGQVATRVWRGPGRFKQSVSDSSFDAWTRFYKQDENAPNAIVSYYAKGSLVALALDLALRRDSARNCSLDDVMRTLWVRHGIPGDGVAEDGMERIISEVSGLDLRQFFDRYLRGTEDLPLAELLADFGVEFTLRASGGQKDKGGVPLEKPAQPSLGIRFAADPAGVRVTHVIDDGAAQIAGLAAGDLIVAVDRLRATIENLERMIAAVPVGDRVPIQAFRRDELMEFGVESIPAPEDTVVLKLIRDPETSVAARRDAWLGLD